MASRTKKKLATRPTGRGRAAYGSSEEDEDAAEAPAQVPQEGTVARLPRGMEAEQERARFQNEVIQSNVKMAAAAQVATREGEDQPVAAKATFILLSGEYEDENGVVYEYDRDQEVVVRSPKELDKMFMNKFRRVGAPTSPGRDFRDVFDRPALMDEPLAVTRPEGFKTQFSQDSAFEAEIERLRAENLHLKERLGEDDDDADSDVADE